MCINYQTMQYYIYSVASDSLQLHFVIIIYLAVLPPEKALFPVLLL